MHPCLSLYSVSIIPMMALSKNKLAVPKHATLELQYPPLVIS